jgi:hypothetical protein
MSTVGAVPAAQDCGETLTATGLAAVGDPGIPGSQGRARIPGSDHVEHAVGKPTVARDRMPWRPVGAGATTVGTPVVLGMLHPLLGEAIAGIEVVVVLTIIATALFGSRALSERAFRLLRWFGNHSEPPGPADGTAGAA